MSRIPFKALRFGARFASSQRDGRTLYDFALYVPDVPNSAALRAKANIPLTMLLGLGGKMVTPETMHLPSDKSQAVASLMIYKAESLEAARKLVEDDVYYTEGVVCTSILFAALETVITSLNHPVG
ncbi:hypothetical protein DL96DRAFT_1709421 [Flagelloscypha sp. PMI_526]|nr:hypothetical protein DL96DRAFT_1709421 [Flagelloscypha sp. PMI_526]